MNRLIALVVLFCLGIALTSCSNEVNKSGGIVASNNASNYDEKDSKLSSAENTDVDLNKFKITNEKDSASSIFAGFTTNNSKQYKRFFFNKFSGTRTIIKLPKNTTFDYKSNLENGKLNTVILDSNYTVLRVLKTNKSESIKLDFANTEEYIIRAVGDEARKGDVVIQVK